MRTTETWGLPLLCLASLAISPVSNFTMTSEVEEYVAEVLDRDL